MLVNITQVTTRHVGIDYGRNKSLLVVRWKGKGKERWWESREDKPGG